MDELMSLKNDYDDLKKSTQKFDAKITEELQTLQKKVDDNHKLILQKFETLKTGQFADTELILKSVIKHIKFSDTYRTAIVASPRSQLKLAKVHGHQMMIDIILSDFFTNSANNLAERKILEIGTMRENIWNQNSTSRLACLARMLGSSLTSVDMDPENAIRAKEFCSPYAGYINFITAPGEEYLAHLDEKTPHYVYIDAYDFDHPNHSDHRQSRYTEILGEEINDEACWKMHLDCAVELVKKLPLEGTIVIDDVWFDKEEWFGKGRTAIPYLMENGFSLIGQTWSTAAFRRL